MDQQYLNELNEQQREAVAYTGGPQLVIAGAGSGKTRVLTYKIVHLLHAGYQPWRILALTFTNKAAREMKDRIEQLVGTNTASRLWMGTFHSIFARILRQNAERIGFKSNFTIYDAADSKSLIKLIIKQLNLDDKIYKPSTVQNIISAAKNALISPEKYASNQEIIEADRQSRRPLLYEIYRIYRDRCVTSCAMDFDDLLYYTNVLFRDNPDVLHHCQEFFRYILVDEYQDTNFAQHVIVSQLCSGENPSLCVVGDDAQSIYSFRGANISNILNLKKAYPTLRTFKLEQNYRSTQTIINAANSLIEKNTRQIRKQVFSKGPVGNRIEVSQSYSDFEEGYLVANRISQVKMLTQDSFEDFAILYRTNAQSRVLEESLRRRNIPYRIYGGVSFYQRKEVKDAIAYFRLSVNPTDDEALQRIINYPSRGIGETTVSKLLAAAQKNKVSMWDVLCDPAKYEVQLNTGTIRKLTDFRCMMDSFIEANRRGDTAEEVATAIFGKTRLLSVLLTENTPENLSKQENLNELLAGVKEFMVNRREEGNENVSLSDFLGEVSLATDQDQTDADGKEKECVTMMTVHAAKGLEFKNIFIVGVEEDLFPSALAKNSLNEIEEERRLLYVAITRAKNFCMMSYASSRYRNGQSGPTSPSRFLRDIDPQYLHLNSGTSLAVPSPSFSTYRDSYHTPSGYQPINHEPSAISHPTPGRAQSGEPPKPFPQSGQFHSPSELSEGMKIEHFRFGKGVITQIDTSRTDARISVSFDGEKNERLLLLKFARFSIIK